ncbi:MAG: NUDIX hydrolase [Candidatus Kerfeldbacteria bacterium]
MKKNNQKIIIVDEQDSIIDFKYREVVSKQDIYRVSALWITNSKSEILLAQRAFSKKRNPGQWGPAVAGTNDKGETYESNIIKEAEEEIGLKNFEYKKVMKDRRTGRLEGYNFFCQWFKSIIDKDINEFVLQEDEVEKIKWFTKDEINNKIENDPKSVTSYIDYCINNL